MSDLDDRRKQTHDRLISMLAELRKEGSSKDDVAYVRIAKALKSVFTAVESDDDLAIFLATCVGVWIQREDINISILVALAEVAYAQGR